MKAPSSEWGRKRLRAGNLDHRVQVLSPAPETRDGFGDAQPAPMLVVTRFASIETLSGRELYTAQQVQADATHRVCMRPVIGIGPAWRLIFQGRTFAILSVLDPTQNGEHVELLCVEQV